jgi:hypothetical protein
VVASELLVWPVGVGGKRLGWWSARGWGRWSGAAHRPKSSSRQWRTGVGVREGPSVGETSKPTCAVVEKTGNGAVACRREEDQNWEEIR